MGKAKTGLWPPKRKKLRIPKGCQAHLADVQGYCLSSLNSHLRAVMVSFKAPTSVDCAKDSGSHVNVCCDQLAMTTRHKKGKWQHTFHVFTTPGLNSQRQWISFQQLQPSWQEKTKAHAPRKFTGRAVFKPGISRLTLDDFYLHIHQVVSTLGWAMEKRRWLLSWRCLQPSGRDKKVRWWWSNLENTVKGLWEQAGVQREVTLPA